MRWRGVRQALDLQIHVFKVEAFRQELGQVISLQHQDKWSVGAPQRTLNFQWFN